MAPMRSELLNIEQGTTKSPLPEHTRGIANRIAERMMFDMNS